MQNTKNFFKNYKLHNWIGLFGLFLYTITFYFSISDFVEYASNSGWKIFFGILDRFTWQSNWLLFIYMFLYTFIPNHQIFKNGRFLICTMVYIFFTFIGYNVVLVGISGAIGYVGSLFSITSNIWIHILCPIYFIVYGFLFMYSNPEKIPQNFIKTLGWGMIYPIIYAIYLIIIPFIFSDYRLNPNADIIYGNINGEAYSVYGSATNTFSNPFSYAYIFVMLLGFFPGSFALFNYSWKWMNEKLNKN